MSMFEENANGAVPTTIEALKNLSESTDIPQLKELVFLIGQQISLKEIARVVADRIRNGTPKEKRDFAATYIDMLTRLAKLQGEMTEDDVSKLADEQIDAMIASGNGRAT